MSNMENNSSNVPAKAIPSADLLDAYTQEVQVAHYSPTDDPAPKYPHLSLGDLRRELARRLGIYDVAQKHLRGTHGHED